METPFLTSGPWFSSVDIAAMISTAVIMLFVLWVSWDCSFHEIARTAGRDLRFHFLRDEALRYYHRWCWYGPRLLVFAFLAGAGAASTSWILSRVVGGSDRSPRSLFFAILLVAAWSGFFLFYPRLWRIAFLRRIRRFRRALEDAAETLTKQWPESAINLPGLGRYEVSGRDPGLLYRADSTYFPLFAEVVGSRISRSQRGSLSFDVQSYPGCWVEFRKDDQASPIVSVREEHSPPVELKVTYRRQHELRLRDRWYLAFYEIETQFDDEESRAEIANRTANVRLPHRGGRFRTLADLELDVVTYLAVPSSESLLPIIVERRILPQNQVVRLDYEPDPSQSTHCRVVPEEAAHLEELLVDLKFLKDPDYRGFELSVPYSQLDNEFEWLEPNR